MILAEDNTPNGLEYSARADLVEYNLLTRKQKPISSPSKVWSWSRGSAIPPLPDPRRPIQPSSVHPAARRAAEQGAGGTSRLACPPCSPSPAGSRHALGRAPSSRRKQCLHRLPYQRASGAGSTPAWYLPPMKKCVVKDKVSRY